MTHPYTVDSTWKWALLFEPLNTSGHFGELRPSLFCSLCLHRLFSSDGHLSKLVSRLSQMLENWIHIQRFFTRVKVIHICVGCSFNSLLGDYLEKTRHFLNQNLAWLRFLALRCTYMYLLWVKFGLLDCLRLFVITLGLFLLQLVANLFFCLSWYDAYKYAI